MAEKTHQGRRSVTPARKKTGRSRSRSVAEPLPHTIALRWAPGAHGAVRGALRGFGQVWEIPAERVIILEFPGARGGPSVAHKVERLKGRGLIEFTAPVLLDKASRLRKIPTDEITIRFRTKKAAVSQLRSMGKRYGVTVARRNEFVPQQYVVKVDTASGDRTLKIAEDMDGSEDVEFAAPNFLSEIAR